MEGWPALCCEVTLGLSVGWICLNDWTPKGQIVLASPLVEMADSAPQAAACYISLQPAGVTMHSLMDRAGRN